MRRGDVVAAVGAGGKTRLLCALAGQARSAGWRVLVTTTTHTGPLGEDETGPLLVEAEGAIDAALERALSRHGIATVLGRRLRPDKLQGLPASRVDALAARVDLLLVEADGARGRSLKLPAEHEPVLPSRTSLLVTLVGLDALGAPLDERCVHRLELVLAASGRQPGAEIDAELVAELMLHPRGYLAHRPPGARAALLLNKLDGEQQRASAEQLARRLVPPWERLVAGSTARGVGWRLA